MSPENTFDEFDPLKFQQAFRICVKYDEGFSYLSEKSLLKWISIMAGMQFSELKKFYDSNSKKLPSLTPFSIEQIMRQFECKTVPEFYNYSKKLYFLAEVLSAEQANPTFDEMRFRTALKQLLEYEQMSKTELARRTGLGINQLSRFLVGGSETKITLEGFFLIIREFNTSNFTEFYNKGEEVSTLPTKIKIQKIELKFEEDPTFDEMLFRRALQHLIDHGSISKGELARRCGISHGQINTFLAGTSNTQISLEGFRAISRAYKAETFTEFYTKGEEAAIAPKTRFEIKFDDEPTFDETLFRLALHYLIDYGQISKEELVRRSGVTKSQINTFLTGESDTLITLDGFRAIRRAYRTSNFTEFYARGEEAAQDIANLKDFIITDSKRFTKAVYSILIAKGWLQKDLAEHCELDADYIRDLLRGERASPDPHKIRRICKELDASSLEDLYDLGKIADRDNPYFHEEFCKAVKYILADKGLTTSDLAEAIGITRVALNNFLSGDRQYVLSMAKCHKIRAKLEVENFREIYKRGGIHIPTPLQPDNGVGSLIGGIAVKANKEVADQMPEQVYNTPLKDLLTNPVLKGRIQNNSRNNQV